MATSSYSRFSSEELILRDYLALDRTVLANERTLLSYVRTALAFAGGGVALIQFVESWIGKGLGWVLVPVGAGTFLVGVIRYVQMRRRLNSVAKPAKGD